LRIHKDIYLEAMRIRWVEEQIAAEYPKQQMRCPVHLSIGQELPAAAIGHFLTKEDYMVSSHRGHAHYLAKGGNLNAFISELYGKKTGCAGGNGGSMHLIDTDCGFLASTSIVAGTVPIGVGAAFYSKLKDLKNLSVVCVGDGALEQGVFHESANFASLHKLPVVFFVENNSYSCFTHISKRQPKSWGNFQRVASGHKIKYLNLDLSCESTVSLLCALASLESALHGVRKGYGPLFVETKTQRFLEHCGPNNDDHLGYRDPPDSDPLKTLGMHLAKQGFLKDKKFYIDLNLKETRAAFEFARAAPYPPESDLGAYLYA